MKLIFAIFTTMLAAAGNWWITGELIETALEDVAQNPAELAQQLESESTANESKAYYLEEAEKKNRTSQKA